MPSPINGNGERVTLVLLDAKLESMRQEQNIAHLKTRVIAVVGSAVFGPIWAVKVASLLGFIHFSLF